jgi:hypothetical protein
MNATSLIALVPATATGMSCGFVKGVCDGKNIPLDRSLDIILFGLPLPFQAAVMPAWAKYLHPHESFDQESLITAIHMGGGSAAIGLALGYTLGQVTAQTHSYLSQGIEYLL